MIFLSLLDETKKNKKTEVNTMKNKKNTTTMNEALDELETLLSKPRPQGYRALAQYFGNICRVIDVAHIYMGCIDDDRDGLAHLREKYKVNQ